MAKNNGPHVHKMAKDVSPHTQDGKKHGPRVQDGKRYSLYIKLAKNKVNYTANTVTCKVQFHEYYCNITCLVLQCIGPPCFEFVSHTHVLNSCKLRKILLME